MSKSKILFITRNLPPLVGGMERLHYHILCHLQKNYELAVVCPEESLREIPDCIKLGFDNRSKLRFIVDSARKAQQLNRKFQADLVFSASGTTILAAKLAAKKHRSPLICQVHGLDVVADNFIYQRIFVPAIRAADMIISISQHTSQLALAKGVNPNKIALLAPGVDLPSSTDYGFAPFSWQNRFVLLSVGRLTRRKGLLEFIRHCLPTLVKQHPQILLAIIGADAEQALERQSSMSEQILAAVTELNLQSHVSLMGKVTETELRNAYHHSQLFIFPTLNLPGDAEGFGMVAIEAAAHGLPVIAFANGGVVDAVAHGESGYLIETDNYQKMTASISSCITGQLQFDTARCLNFARQFSWTEYGKKLDQIINASLQSHRA